MNRFLRRLLLAIILTLSAGFILVALIALFPRRSNIPVGQAIAARDAVSPLDQDPSVVKDANTIYDEDLGEDSAAELIEADKTDTEYQSYLPLIGEGSGSGAGWPMAGANPGRTSWTSEEVRDVLSPIWFRPIEPYILPKVQVVAAHGMLFISTSRGLYALDAATGQEVWVYPTAMPLGHSPTIYQGVAYVGGLDGKIHAVDAWTGAGLWTYQAKAGFSTNPLVIGDKLFAGSRDGLFNAINISGPGKGEVAWSYQTGGPIMHSAAYADGVVYFASNDSHAYALEGATGDLFWRSEKLPGAGFHSWWPVVFGDWVIFAGSNNYRNARGLDFETLRDLDRNEVFPNFAIDPKGTLVGPLGTEDGPWVQDTVTVDASQPTITANGATLPIVEYLEGKPWRRTTFVLNRADGREYTTDFDQDGLPEYAPYLWFGTHGAGNRYPPVVGGDGVLYQTNNYMSDPFINGGHITGWTPGSPYFSVISSDWGAVDEPHAYAAGGDLIYWNLCCDRQAGAIDISQPNTGFAEKYLAGDLPPTGGLDGNREWLYFNYNLPEQIPGYNTMVYTGEDGSDNRGGVYGGRNGSYGWHGDLNPPIPYQGRVYMHRSNAIIAFGPEGEEVTGLPLATTVAATGDNPPVDVASLKEKLSGEVAKMIAAGHLRPGYLSSGLFDNRTMACGGNLADYWHHPGDTITTLLLALPHLPPEQQDGVRAYIQSEFENFPPYQFNHIGWRDGAARELLDLPPEIEAERPAYKPEGAIQAYLWKINPNTFYALWRYAVEFGGAAGILAEAQANDNLMNSLDDIPPDPVLLQNPADHNAYIAGLIGYVELGALAGLTSQQMAGYEAERDRLLDLRANSFSVDTSDDYIDEKGLFYCRSLNSARNFMYLVPELAHYLRDHAMPSVQAAVTEYLETTPYWFVALSETMLGEGVLNHRYDYQALFQAQALILGASQEELVKFLDVPAFQVGDLFYIQNLVFTLEATTEENR